MRIVKVALVLMTFLFLLLTVNSKNLKADESTCAIEREKCRKTCTSLTGEKHDICLLKCYKDYNECTRN
jgi:hypothetical protein